MKCECHAIRSGYDGTKCLVHARCCAAPGYMLATAQYLDVSGCDLFSGLYSSISTDGGETWSEFVPEAGLEPIIDGDTITVACDATPMYHKKSGRVILLGHTAEYKKGAKAPTGRRRYTFYSIWDAEKKCFSKLKFIEMPEGFERCGNGSGQSLELDNGELLIPVYFTPEGTPAARATVLRAELLGDELKVLEIGNILSFEVARGLDEPSIIFHDGTYYMTIRNDECGLVAKSTDGINYTNLTHLMWDDDSLVQNYNTQQHWMVVGGELYLVYTRRGANNDRVFRHRAPLFAAKFSKMRLVRDSEFPLTPERGARLGNFSATSLDDGRAMVMAAEWMQPVGCEKYGSDNSIFLTFVRADN